jgi:hypothetical protein
LRAIPHRINYSINTVGYADAKGTRPTPTLPISSKQPKN